MEHTRRLRLSLPIVNNLFQAHSLLKMDSKCPSPLLSSYEKLELFGCSLALDNWIVGNLGLEQGQGSWEEQELGSLKGQGRRRRKFHYL